MNFCEIRQDPFGRRDIDPASRALTGKDGRTARLRHKSKEVLAYLVQNPDRTVGKSEILDAVWSDVTVSDESLVQCIADIRRIIGRDARQIVETIPREGYRVNLRPGAARPGRSLVLPGLAIAAALGAVTVYLTGSQDTSHPADAIPDPQVRALPPGTDIVEAYLEVLQGRVSADRFSLDESLIAERHFRKAIALDPAYPRAYAELGILFAVRFENNWTVLPKEDKEKALYYAEKAAELDPDLWLAHYALGRLHSVLANYEISEAHLERAMSLQPDNEDARAYLGIVKNFQGDAEGAVAILEPALASHPNPPFWYYLGLGNSLFHAGKYERAASTLNTCLELAVNSPYCLRYLMAVYGAMGRVADAKATSLEYASMGFEPTVTSIMSVMTFHNPTDRARLEEAFKAAGLPE